jgi:hypothetical protein
MAAPKSPPSWCEPIWDADKELDPVEQTADYIDDFASTPKYFPDWLAEEPGIEFSIQLISHVPRQSAEIGFVAAGRQGVVRFAHDPSGWMKVTAEFEGVPVFTGYLDHPYENCEIWPEDAETIDRLDHLPGVVGKHKTWFGLDSKVWTVLAPLCRVEGESITFKVDDSKLRPI